MKVKELVEVKNVCHAAVYRVFTSRAHSVLSTIEDPPLKASIPFNIYCMYFSLAEMEIIPEGRHFRLVHESELSEILVTLERYLPESLKVCPGRSCHLKCTHKYWPYNLTDTPTQRR